MICVVNIEELSGKIKPSVIKRYLEENGWKLFETKRSDISIYQYFQNDQFEQVTIPNERTLFDYSMAMYDAVRTIAAVEKKPVEQILPTLLSPSRDILVLPMPGRGQC